MVFNNTKVLSAELVGYRPARSDNSPSVEVSLTLIERLPGGSALTLIMRVIAAARRHELIC